MVEIKYKSEIEKILRDSLFEDWMTEEDYNEVIELIFKELNTSMEKLSEDIQIGINNGYSLDLQIVILNKYLNGNKTK